MYSNRILLIDDLTANEQNVVGNWLMLISQILITNAAAQALIERRVHGPIMNTNSEEVKILTIQLNTILKH